MGELNVTFGGICISLHSGVVPGVPMRTVVPDAQSVRFGAVRIPGMENFPSTVHYYLMPHVARLRTQMVGGIGFPLTGQYITVANAKDQPFCRAGGGFSLNEFKPDVRLDPNVVFEGNARAYFDIFGGRVWTEGKDDEARLTRVSIKTNGKPQINISPLPGNVIPWLGEATIETDELYITNLDYEAATEDFQFDFLMNFLVAEGGIPQELYKRTPGMTRSPKPLTMNHLGERLKALGTLVETEGTVSGWWQAVARGDESEPAGGLPHFKPTAGEKRTFTGSIAIGSIDPVPFDPSCSTSNYP